MKRTTRRDFLKRLAFAPDSSPEPHTLICVFLRGGADTLNMVIPYADDAYYHSRPTLAIAAPSKGKPNASLRLNDHYSFHPKMAPLLPAFKDGRMAIVQGVGSDNSSGSHFDAQDQLEHGESFGKKLVGGWLGRHLRTKGASMTPLSAVAIGKAIPEALRGAPCASALASIDDVKLTLPKGNVDHVASALSSLYAADVDLLGQAGRSTLDLLSRVEKLKHSSQTATGHGDYPDSNFGKALKEVSRLVKAEVGLEVACIDHDNWDTHFFQGAADGLQAGNIEDLSNGLGALYHDIEDHLDRTTIMVMTEFGRRIYENSSMGTDHGRGFAIFTIGGKIKGGQVIGNLPSLEEDPQFLLGPGGLIVQLDYRSVLAEILQQLLGNQDIKSVFPGFRPQTVGLV